MNRVDAHAKLRGEAEFGTDLELPGMLWGVLVPSPTAHGRVVRLDLDRARRIPGVVAVVGPVEVAKLLPNGGGDPERPLFPTEVIAYRNQPIAAVAATSLEAARAAAGLVSAEIEEKPVTADLDAVFPDWPGPDGASSPQVIAHVLARQGDLAGEFRSADFVHSETYRTNAVQQVALEPHACLAWVDAGNWYVRSSTQSPFAVREDAATLLGIPESSLIVEGSWVGGGFGGKASAFLEPYALILAAATGRPVKLQLSYREEFELARSTLPAVIRMDTAVRNGEITARRVRLLLDTGASLPGRDFATGYAIGFLLGPYRVGTFEMEGYAVRTNKPPFGPHRAPFAPQCAFVAESHIDGLATRLGRDPVEFRRSIAWREGDSTALGQKVGPIGLSECLLQAENVVREWRKGLPAGHGIGVGCGFWSTSTGAGGEARLRVTAQEIIIEQVEREIGSGSVIRGLSAVVERVLGVPANAVRVVSLSTAVAPFDSGVFGSRTVGALGRAVEQAANALARSLGTRLGVSEPARLLVTNGVLVACVGSTFSPVGALLTPDERAQGGLVVEGRHYGAGGALDETRVIEGTFYPYTDFTSTVHVAEVEVDRETGQVRPVRYVAFHDVGTVIDAVMVRGQVEGGVAMGLGAALTEESLWTSDGRLLNPGLLDYRIPTLGEIPPIEVVAVEGYAGAGPFGAKGLGEPPIIPVPATIANAIADATGSRLLELPATPERVGRALKLV